MKELEPLQGRWHGRASDGTVDVERYIDVNAELFFRAVHYHRGGAGAKSQQGVFSIERLAKARERWEADLVVVRWLEDGRDRSTELGGSKLRALCEFTQDGLLIAFSEIDGPRPPDLSAGEAYRKK